MSSLTSSDIRVKVLTFPHESMFGSVNSSIVFSNITFDASKEQAFDPVILAVLSGTILYYVMLVSNTLFFAAADLLMILRIYAMYNRSRLVFGVLLASYILAVVLRFIVIGIFYKPHIGVAVVFGTKSCTVSYSIAPALNAYFIIPHISFNVLLCGFAVVHFVRESLQMHRAIKQWRSNRYMELLVQGSMLYFTAYLPSHVTTIVIGIDVLQGLASVLLGMLSTIPPMVLPARLIMSMREFHSRIVGEHIDTGFGAISRHQISMNDHMVFANVEALTESTVDYRGTEGVGTSEQV
ncbi:hypothetical protein BU15DRAFT_75620 [Melanogaster broomeanus]|nr:hypothetical protein BU15DRAFT_75620 [Melanogaster broomeanus]